MESESDNTLLDAIKLCLVAIPVLGIPLVLFLMTLQAFGIIKILIF